MARSKNWSHRKTRRRRESPGHSTLISQPPGGSMFEVPKAGAQ
jgi:hypothetical protein